MSVMRQYQRDAVEKFARRDGPPRGRPAGPARHYTDARPTADEHMAVRVWKNGDTNFMSLTAAVENLKQFYDDGQASVRAYLLAGGRLETPSKAYFRLFDPALDLPREGVACA